LATSRSVFFCFARGVPLFPGLARDGACNGLRLRS